MSRRPRARPGNGRTGPAAARRAPGDDRRPLLAAGLAGRWAIILSRFRDYLHHGGAADDNGHRRGV